MDEAKLLKRKFGCRFSPDIKIYLNFSEIYPFFLILAVGFSIALLTLFGEIFYHDFLSQLSEEYFERKFGWMRETKKQKAKVRKIKVKPAEIQKLDEDQRSNCL